MHLPKDHSSDGGAGESASISTASSAWTDATTDQWASFAAARNCLRMGSDWEVVADRTVEGLHRHGSMFDDFLCLVASHKVVVKCGKYFR